MKKNVYVSVSTDPVTGYQEIVDYAKEMQGEADFLHCDIMDGEFVGKTTFDENLIKNINSASLIMLDVHLMVKEPFALIEKYIDVGANFITVHYESFADKNELVKAIKYIKSRGALAGISLKPNTKFKEIKPFVFDIDLILVMSVNPGFGGQKYIDEVNRKIEDLLKIRYENDLNFEIEVDGGINKNNINIVSKCGADIIVAGNAIFGAEDKKSAVLELKKFANG